MAAGSITADATHRALMTAFAREIPQWNARAMHQSLVDLGVDSFGEVVLRGAVEEAIGRDLPDLAWLACETPADIVEAALSAGSGAARPALDTYTDLRRYRLGMPQLTTAGLSESWLLKESGDLHWSMVAAALQTAPQAITDADGNRLYATVSRLVWHAEPSLGAFGEGDSVTLSGSVKRYGPGLFLSTQQLDGAGGQVALDIMTTFAFRDRSAAHGGLRMASPTLPAVSDSAEPGEVSDFVSGYREARRNGPPATSVASCEYRIVPHHDINAVGVLYFAAYPTIAEICDWQLAQGRDSGWRSVARDICYLANCGADETLTYTVHSVVMAHDGQRHQVASLARRSDGMPIALLTTRYRTS